MQRVCFQLQVKPERMAEYVERHAHGVAGHAGRAGRDRLDNYSLFLRDDGLLIGYFETPSLADGPGGHGRHRGERPLAGGDGRVLRRPRRAGARHGLPAAREIFHLEDQLSAGSTTTARQPRRRQ